MKKMYFFLFLIITVTKIQAQPKNYVKISAVDCINCTSILSQLLQKDPKISLVLHEDFLLDSTDIIEKFNLRKYCKQIVWNSALYDSLSSTLESELIQYCGTKEINRSSFKKLYFSEAIGCDSNTICLKGLSNHIMFKDYKNFLLITNHINYKQYIYNKKQKNLKEVLIDTVLLRSIYVDNLKDTKMYSNYLYECKATPSVVPKIKSIYPYDDSTVLGALVTYRIDISGNADTVLSQMLSIIKINNKGANQVVYLNNSLSNPHQFLSSNILVYKDYVYFPLNLDVDGLKKYNLGLENLARFKKTNNSFKFDKYMPTTLNDYLIENRVLQNFNSNYIDNGYSLMSLSNYIINLNNEEKIYLPFEDSLFKRIHIYPALKGISYNVIDFKYNINNKKFHLLYEKNKGLYYASFFATAKTNDIDCLLFTYDNSFTNSFKNMCLSWNGEKIVYCMKNENCFRVATVDEILQIAKTYQKPLEK